MDIYLDNNATTLLTESLREEAKTFLEKEIGNPASPHSWGGRASRVLVAARDRTAEFIGARENQVIFTSGGSESNTQVLRSFAGRFSRPVHLITTGVEHQSVLAGASRLSMEGHRVTILPVGPDGRVSPEDLIPTIVREEPTLVSIQWVNNETGVIQDIKKLEEVAHLSGAAFHTDAAQAIGKIPVNMNEVAADFLTFTGHKIHAPAGVGVIYSRNPKEVLPLIYGGEQEFGVRPGTPNLLGIHLLALALCERSSRWDDHISHLRLCRDMFESLVTGGSDDVLVNGKLADRVASTTNLQFGTLDGRAIIAHLDNEGVIASQSSACTSQSPEPSHVLSAMGLSENAAWASVRFSFSIMNTVAEVGIAAEKTLKVYRRLKKTAELWDK